MNCGNCGAFLQPGATSCPSCGSPVLAKPNAAYGQPMQQPYGAPQGQPYQQAPYGAPQSQPYQQAPYGAPQGQPYQQAPYGQPYMGGAQSPYDIAAMRGQGMKWFKFIVYFALIAGAILNVIAGLVYMSGNIWSLSAGGGQMGEWVKAFIYEMAPGVRVVDILFGIGCIISGVLCFMARQKLAAFKIGAPSFFLKAIVINGVIGVVGCILYYVQIGPEYGSSMLSSAISSAVGTVIWYFIHKSYMDHRADLFTNP